MNNITKYEALSQIIYSLKKILSLLMTFFDMFKDTYLTIYVLMAIGGWKVLYEYPGQFNTVFVACQLASILLPLGLSGLHLAANNPGMIFNCSEVKLPWWKRMMMQVAVIVLSVFNPLLIINCYESCKEKMRKCAKVSSLSIVMKRTLLIILAYPKS